MTIPDQSHINRVREALWQRPEGCASVMVGAGFSRNAQMAGPHAQNFPLWPDIAKSLCDRLYPPCDGHRLDRAITEASATSGFLRLAQEYEAAFGRGALHKFIQEAVPNEDYVPDEIHKRLLGLPWKDVFTTNWDTLLERTRILVTERAYGVVRTTEELPSTPKPRIVKLHGSFPAHIPFIFTEEDYRTYPKRFAPFVNTVQQAMMETVFCLIGFSGDDPNFLHWSGWVRDNLGESAPKIYLAGWLDLSPHRRRMLEERNVVPIDLARHPKAAQWPEHLRHRYATEWLLHTLERGRPYDLTQWPSPPDKKNQPSILEDLQPVEEIVVDIPMEEPQPPRGGEELENLAERVRALIKAWQHNRKVYPGWLFIPPSKHSLIEMDSDGWERVILNAIPSFLLLEKLSAIRELVWRRENLLEPLSKELEDAIQSILGEIDCQARKINGIEDRSVQWADIREMWRDLALALLTASRQRFDRVAFDWQLMALQAFLGDHPDVAQRVHHEKCLWALNHLDYAKLDELLKAWRPEGCDPIWMTRKAAILVETNRNDEAIRLLNRSLSIVREAPCGGNTLASASREGWMLGFVLAFNNRLSPSTEEELKIPPIYERWQHLAFFECDASKQKRNIRDALQGDPEKKDGPLFDLHAHRVESIGFSNAAYRRMVAAHRAIRLGEIAGLPSSAFHVAITYDIIALAADYLVITNYGLASRLILRVAISGSNATFNRIWSRSRIATLQMEKVKELVDLVTNAIAYLLPRAISTNKEAYFWMARLDVVTEALSRLVLRLPPEQAKDIFKQALGYYRMEGVAKEFRLHNSMGNLLTQSWEALPKSWQADLVLDVLSAPIVGLDGFGEPFHHVDPSILIGSYDKSIVPARSPETEGRWVDIVHLINRGLLAGGEARKRAASRLATLAFWNRLTKSEIEILAQSLWHGDFVIPGGLPNGTSLYPWVFLLLPQPELGLAEKILRTKWLVSKEFKNKNEINGFFWYLGTALAALKSHRNPLTLTSEERAYLESIVHQWVMLPVIVDGSPWENSGIGKGIIGLQSILPEIELPPAVAEALFSKIERLNQTKIPGFRLFASLAKHLPSRLDDIAISMRMGLASNNAEIAQKAVIGLHAWLMAAAEETASIPAPPDDLVREIGVIIATRRKGVLSQALQLAKWIFSNGTSNQRDSIAQFSLHGLRYLIEELRYDREHTEEEETEIPLLRWGCAHLALAMSVSGYAMDSSVVRWIEITQNDPLPEVRYAEGPALISMVNENAQQGE